MVMGMSVLDLLDVIVIIVVVGFLGGSNEAFTVDILGCLPMSVHLVPNIGSMSAGIRHQIESESMTAWKTRP